jgi:flagellar basal-body rod protein FlgF
VGYDDKARSHGTHRPPARRGHAGNAWLAVQGLDGTEAYTRAGALDVDAEGLLVTPNRAAGAGRRRPDHRATQHQLQIATDGTISAQGRSNRPAHHHPGRPAQAGDARRPSCSAATDGLFRAADGRPAGRRHRAAAETARSRAPT